MHAYSSLPLRTDFLQTLHRYLRVYVHFDVFCFSYSRIIGLYKGISYIYDAAVYYYKYNSVVVFFNFITCPSPRYFKFVFLFHLPWIQHRFNIDMKTNKKTFMWHLGDKLSLLDKTFLITSLPGQQVKSDYRGLLRNEKYLTMALVIQITCYIFVHVILYIVSYKSSQCQYNKVS